MSKRAIVTTIVLLLLLSVDRERGIIYSYTCYVTVSYIVLTIM